MTIRQTLLIAFLMFSVLFATLMTALAYHRSRAALSTEIRQSLETQALTLTQQIEAMIFERVNDLQGWRRLDFMQDVKVGDIDKRLSRFLSEIKTAYAGMYNELLCIRDRRIVAASNAVLIGQDVMPTPSWLEFEMPDGMVVLTRPDGLSASPEMLIRSDLADAFSDRKLGEIHARFNWLEIVQLLDHATAKTGRHALLLDVDQRPLAVSARLRAQIGASDLDLSEWPVGDAGHGVFDISGDAMKLDSLLVGHARTAAYRGLPDLGWSVLILTPERAAFASIHRLLWTLIALLGGSMLIAVILAVRISALTARPIQELTQYTRDIGAHIDTPPRLIRGSREIEELNLAFNHMIGDLKQSRDRLIRVSKLAAVGEMAAKLAHEVRTPLGIIRSSAQLLDRQRNLDPAGHEMMNFMINECDRINQLVTGLLESTRPRHPVLEPHEVNAIIRHVAEMLRPKLEQKDLTLELPPKDAAFVVACDRDQMIQVLLNLLMNGIQMLPPGGHIRVATSVIGDGFQLDIDDDGPGVPPDSRETILEPLVSNRSGGIGLGLSIVREIVTMHNGTVRVMDSDLGGARFSIYLPRAVVENTDVAS